MILNYIRSIFGLISLQQFMNELKREQKQKHGANSSELSTQQIRLNSYENIFTDN